MRMGRFLLVLAAMLALFPLSCSQDQFSSRPIVIYGDTRTDHLAHQKVVETIMKTKPLAVFHTGDLVGNGLDPDHWTTFNTIVSELIKIADFYPALGNHERNSQLFFDNFNLPNNEQWYSLEINGIHFIVLDSNSDIRGTSEQYRWLKSDLKDINGENKFIIVIFHHPPFSTGPHKEDETGLRQGIIPLFEEYGVDIVFSGHDHIYERSLYNNIYYVVAGGGGAPLYDQERTSPHSQVFRKTYHFCRLTVRNRELIVEVFDTDLNLIDEFKMEEKR